MSEALGITAFYIFIAAIIVAAVLYLNNAGSALWFYLFSSSIANSDQISLANHRFITNNVLLCIHAKNKERMLMYKTIIMPVMFSKWN
ncbi:hypothetical protein DMH88_01570 [Escherichia coli]|nr:hypothetical protein [Escherichia coli]